MTHRQMDLHYIVLFQKITHGSVRFDHWFAHLVADHFDVSETHFAPASCTHRLKHGFLGGETRRVAFHPVFTSAAIRDFRFRKDPIAKGVTFIDITFNTFYLDNIRTYAKNHCRQFMDNFTFSRFFTIPNESAIHGMDLPRAAS